MHLPLSFVFLCVYFWLCQPAVLIFETDIDLSLLSLDVIKMCVLLLQQNTLLTRKNTKVSFKDLIYTGFSSIIKLTRADIKETIPFICKEEL